MNCMQKISSSSSSAQVGLAISAPTAAHFSSTINAQRILGASVALVALSALGTALSPSFPVLLACRLLAGLGCGPFIALAAPLIDDSAPKHRRSAFLAVLFVCWPTGFACGFLWATLISSAYGWRAVFLFESAVMTPLASILLFSAHPHTIKRGGSNPTSSLESSLEQPTFFQGVLQILRLPVVAISIVAIAIFNGALGGFSYFGSKAAASILSMDAGVADLIFGGVTVVTGALGTLGGGALLDAVGSSVHRALLMCMCGVGICATALTLSFALTGRLITFCPAFLVGEIALFATSVPATGVLMWSVPAALRPTALALSEIANHLLIGDVFLPPLLGLLQEHVGNWRLTMCMCTAMMGAAAVLFGVARYVLLGKSGDGIYQAVVVVPIDGDGDDNSIESPLL